MLFKKFGQGIFLILLGFVFVPGLTNETSAAENAKGTYLLGSAGPQAGMLPPVAGVFSSSLVYIYSGEANPNLEIPIGGNLAVGVDADIVLGAASALWVPDAEFLGGRIGLFGLIPIGSVGLDVDALLTGPGGVPIGGASLSQSRVSVGDPQVGGLIGWNSGPFHWNAGWTVNLPIGDYEVGRLDNLAFNRWSVDLRGALTWLDPAIGFELSATAGITINGRNSATDYKTGEEFHLEFAAIQHFSKEVQAGFVGYYYNQISGDSGSGAVLGSFKGEVVALGPYLSMTFPVGQVPVTLSGRGYVEFGAKNRLEGAAGYVIAGFPLYVAGPPPGAP